MEIDPKVLEDIRSRDIPEDIKRRAITAAIKIAKDEKDGFNRHGITVGDFCIWHITEEGEKFWSMIYWSPKIKELLHA